MTNLETAILSKEREILLEMAMAGRKFAKLEQRLGRGADVFHERHAALRDLIKIMSGSDVDDVATEAVFPHMIRYLAEQRVEKEAAEFEAMRAQVAA